MSDCIGEGCEHSSHKRPSPARPEQAVEKIPIYERRRILRSGRFQTRSGTQYVSDGATVRRADDRRVAFVDGEARRLTKAEKKRRKKARTRRLLRPVVTP